MKSVIRLWVDNENMRVKLANQRKLWSFWRVLHRHGVRRDSKTNNFQ